MAAFHISIEQRNQWIHNSLVFLAPLAIIYFGGVAESLQNGFSWSSLIPSYTAQGSIALYLANVALDFFRKYIPNN